jgi:hypothetical protein
VVRFALEGRIVVEAEEIDEAIIAIAVELLNGVRSGSPEHVGLPGTDFEIAGEPRPRDRWLRRVAKKDATHE